MERYFTFWRRLGAGIFDGLLLGIFSLIVLHVAASQSWEDFFYWTVFIFVCSTLYTVLLTGLMGQTLGKIALGIKVLDQADETNVIGIKRALYRESVPVALQAFGLIYSACNFYSEPASYHYSQMVDDILEYAAMGWLVAELATMFFNKRRRAIHDFLASSVVIGMKGLKFDQHYDALESAQIQPANKPDENRETAG